MVVHYLLNASTIFIVDAASEDTSSAEKSTSALNDCLDLLESISEVWLVAKNAIALINSIKTDQEKCMGKAQHSFGGHEEETDIFAFTSALPGEDALAEAGLQSLVNWDMSFIFQDKLQGPNSTW